MTQRKTRIQSTHHGSLGRHYSISFLFILNKSCLMPIHHPKLSQCGALDWHSQGACLRNSQWPRLVSHRPPLFWVNFPRWRGKPGVLADRAKSKRPRGGEEMRKRQASRWEDTRTELKNHLMKNALKFLLWSDQCEFLIRPPPHKTFRIIYLWDFRAWPLMGEERRWE